MTKDQLLSKINDELDVYREFFRSDIVCGKLYVSPLRSDKRATFNVYRKGHRVMFKDFAGEQGDIFDFLKHHPSYNCDFIAAINLIAFRFGLSDDSPLIRSKNWSRAPHVDIYVRAEFDYEIAEFNRYGFSATYWRNYGVEIELLEEYDTKSVAKYEYVNANGKLIVQVPKIGDPIFVYEFPYSKSKKSVVKLYRPHSELKAMKFRGNLRATDVFGLKQLLEFEGKHDIIGIVGGQKDALAIRANTGIYCVAPPSESTHFDRDIFELIKTKSHRQFVMFDNDTAGFYFSSVIAYEFMIPNVEMSSFLDIDPCYISDKDAKIDIADYYYDLLLEDEPEDKFQILIDRMT
jgi:hypothetical protein